MRNLVTKEKKLKPSSLLLWTELTEMLQRLGRGAPAVARWLPPGRHISITLKGSSQLGERLRNPPWFSTRHRTRSQPRVPICVHRWSPYPYAVAASAQRLDPWGVQKGFRGKTGFGPVDRGVRGPPVARLVVTTGVRVSGDDILQDPLG
jgi:hypothetical protein